MYKPKPAPPLHISPLRAPPEDTFLPAPSDDDSSPRKRRKLEARTKLGQAYLTQHTIYIASAQLRGPFSGPWRNPWATDDDDAMARGTKNATTKNKGNRKGSKRPVIDLASQEPEAHPVRFETPSNTSRQRSASRTPKAKPKPGDTVIDIAATSDDEAYRPPESSQKRKKRASVGPEGSGSVAKRQATGSRSRAATVPPPLNHKHSDSEGGDVSDDAMDVDSPRGRGRRKPSTPPTRRAYADPS